MSVVEKNQIKKKEKKEPTTGLTCRICNTQFNSARPKLLSVVAVSMSIVV